MKLTKTSIIVWSMLLASAAAKAQETPSASPFKVNLQVKNMHLWRGFAVTEAPMTALNASYTIPSTPIKLGVWGGGGFNGTYREFDYYLAINKGGFKFEIWDILNFSTSLPATKLFDYNPKSTRHFIDVTLGYQFDKSFPLYISASTIVFGSDRKSLPSDMLATPTGKDPLRSGRNRYSTYLNAEYPIYNQNGYNVKLYLSGAFALNGEKQNFYGSKSNIVATGFIVSRAVTIGSYSIPVSATALWNPELNIGNIQLAVDLF